MSASRGGPWTQSLRLLRLLASAVGNQNRVATAQVDPAPRPAPTGDAPLPRRAPHCSARDRGELQPRAPPRTRSPPPPPPPQHPWGTGDFKGVWGFGSREITGTERRLSLPWERFLLRSCGRCAGEGAGGRFGGKWTFLHNPHAHRTRTRRRLPLPSPASLLGYFRQSRLALAQPDLLCWGRGRGSKGQSAPACAARCARARGHRCIGVRPSGGLELRTNVGGLSVSSRRSVVVCVTRSHQCTSNVWTPSVQNFAGVR